MYFRNIVKILILLLFTGVLVTFAQDTLDGTDSNMVWRKANVTGIIKEIDYSRKYLIVNGIDSLLYSFAVDKSVPVVQFDVGDTVAIAYYQPFLIDFGIPTPEERQNPDQMIEGAVSPPPGTNTGVDALPQVKTLATINSLNDSEKTVVVTGSQGNRFLLFVPDKRLFAQLNVNDELVIIYAQGLAVTINKKKVVS